MGHAIMPRNQDRALKELMPLAQHGREPILPAIFGQKIGMEDGAITKRVFQHAVDGRAAGTGKMNNTNSCAL